MEYIYIYRISIATWSFMLSGLVGQFIRNSSIVIWSWLRIIPPEKPINQVDQKMGNCVLAHNFSGTLTVWRVSVDGLNYGDMVSINGGFLNVGSRGKKEAARMGIWFNRYKNGGIINGILL